MDSEWGQTKVVHSNFFNSAFFYIFRCLSLGFCCVSAWAQRTPQPVRWGWTPRPTAGVSVVCVRWCSLFFPFLFFPPCLEISFPVTPLMVRRQRRAGGGRSPCQICTTTTATTILCSPSARSRRSAQPDLKEKRKRICRNEFL